MTPPYTDIHDSVLAEIEARIGTLQSGAPTSAPEGGAWTQAEVDDEVAKLQRDEAVLLSHWQTKDGLVVADAPVRARACGQPQPCPHVLGLAQEYGLI